MGISLSESARAMVDGPNFAVLCTINPDGSPQSSAMWVGLDGDDLLFTTVVGRRKDLNMRRDPRVSVTVLQHDNPYNYVEIRGEASFEDGGVELDQELSLKYDGKDADRDEPGTVRTVVRVTPTKVTGYAA